MAAPAAEAVASTALVDPQALKGTEASFTGIVDALYEKLLDLNVPNSMISEHATKLMGVRHSLLGMYGVPPDPRWNTHSVVGRGPALGWPAAAAPAAWGPEQSRAKLMELATKRAGKQRIDKDDFTFETDAVDERGKMYVTTLNSSLLSQEYKTPVPCHNKKLAEQQCATAALEAEFPEASAHLSALGAAGAEWSEWWSQGGKGKKRKSIISDPANADAKSLLSHNMSVLLDRSVTKADLVYDVTPAEGGYAATLTMPNYDGGKRYQGDPAASRKDAEHAAAQAALDDLQDIIAPALEAHQEKKIRKALEIRGAHREKRMGERKTAKGAGKGAAVGLSAGPVSLPAAALTDAA